MAKQLTRAERYSVIDGMQHVTNNPHRRVIGVAPPDLLVPIGCSAWIEWMFRIV